MVNFVYYQRLNAVFAKHFSWRRPLLRLWSWQRLGAPRLLAQADTLASGSHNYVEPSGPGAAFTRRRAFSR